MLSIISTVVLLSALVFVQIPMIMRRHSWGELSITFLMAGALETASWTFDETSSIVAITEAVMSICFIVMAVIVLLWRLKVKKSVLGKRARDVVAMAMELEPAEMGAVIEAIKAGGHM